MDSTAARIWALKSIPPMVRESLIHQISTYNTPLCDNTVIKFWSILYSSQFYYVHVPADLSETCRKTLMQYLCSGLEEDKPVPTLIFKVAGASSPREIEAELKFMKNAHFLSIFVHRKGADDNLLKIIGENCPFLQVKKISG